MYVRVVRFTDVAMERMEDIDARIEQSGGPPQGVNATGLTVLHDAEQGTAVVLQYYDSAEDMAEAAKAFDALDPSETPGTRASVDACQPIFQWEPA